MVVTVSTTGGLATVKMYFNGALVSATTQYTFPTDDVARSQCTIGGNRWVSQGSAQDAYFKGSLAEIAFYNYVRN